MSCPQKSALPVVWHRAVCSNCVTACSICVTVSLCVPSVSLCHFVYRVVNVLCSALCAGLNYWCLALGALQMVLVHCSSILQEQVTM